MPPSPLSLRRALHTLSDKAPDSDNWVHEIKFDGYRIQARLDRGKVKLLTRKGLDWTKKFPTIADAVAKLPAKSAMIDGEVVVEDAMAFRAFRCCNRTSKQTAMIAWCFMYLILCISKALT